MLAASPNTRAETFNIAAEATSIGTVLPVFGISALPAGPFTGTLSFVAPLGPNHDYAKTVELTAFDFAVGDTTWSLIGVESAHFGTDASGEIDKYFLSVFSEAGFGGSLLWLSHGVYGNIDWAATDVRAGGWCDFGYDGVVAGTCIGGGPGTVTVRAIPEPATYAMMLVGLGAFGVAVRRRESRSIGDC